MSESITAAEAKLQADTLADAAQTSPIRQYRFELARRAAEWRNAEADLAAVGDGGAIELIGSVTPGMAVLGADEGRAVYFNRFGPASPVVVAS